MAETSVTLPLSEILDWWMGSGKGKERSKFFEGVAKAMADQWG